MGNIFIQPDAPIYNNKLFTDFGSYETVLNIPITIPTAELQRFLNEKIPAEFLEEYHDVKKIRDLIKNNTVLFELNRTAINLQTYNNRIKISTSISGVVRLKGRLDLKVFKTRISAHGNITGELVGEIFLTIDENWNIVPSIQLLDINLSEAEIPIKAIGTSLSLRSILTELLIEPNIDKFSKKLSQKISKKLNIQKAAKKIWEQLYLSKLINKEPPIWIRVEPRRVIFKPFDINYQDKICAGLGITAFVDTVIAHDCPPVAPTKMPLPLLEFQSNLSDQFSIYLPVQLSIQIVNQQFTKVIKNQSFEVAENISITIEEIKLTSNADQLVVQLDFKSNDGSYFNVSGSIFLIGNVHYDKLSNSIQILNLDYEFNTKRTLASVANWLLKPILLSKIEKQLVFSLDSKQRWAMDEVNKQLENLKIPKDIYASVKIKTIELQKVILQNEFFHLMMECKGNLSAQLFKTVNSNYTHDSDT